MPKGPKGEKRPRDVVGAAVKSMRVLTGDDRDTPPSSDTTPAKKKKSPRK